MKTKTYSLPLFTLLITTAIYFNSCTPDETQVCGTAYNTTVNFTADELSKVPYTGFDTLYFKDINGDTNIVVGGGKKYYYDKEYKTHGGPACPPDVTNMQAYKIEFKPIKGSLNFIITQERKGYDFIITKENYIAKFIIEYYQLGITGSDSERINNITYEKVLKDYAYTGTSYYQKDTTYKIYHYKPTKNIIESKLV